MLIKLYMLSANVCKSFAILPVFIFPTVSTFKDVKQTITITPVVNKIIINYFFIYYIIIFILMYLLQYTGILLVTSYS